MRKNTIITAAIGVCALALTSCGGSSSSSSDAMLFGKVPGIVEKFNEKRAELKEKLTSVSSEEEAKSVVEDYDKLFEKTRSEVEAAAQSWSGSALAIESDDEWTVKTPVTVTFDGFVSKSSLDVRYNLEGEVVAAKDIALDENNSTSSYDGTMLSKTVMLIGYDAEGQEVTNSTFGFVTPTKTADGGVIAAGTPLKLEPLKMNDKKPEEYLKIKSLKLVLQLNK